MIPRVFVGAFMRLKRLAVLAITTAFAGLGAVSAQAQGITTIDRPAEMPPASFTGKQFADSRGCLFVRAGFDGAVIWVPRMTRDREQVCGYKPTFGKTRTAAAPDPQPAPKPVAKPAPKPKVAAAPKPKPTPAPKKTVAKRQPMKTVASKPAPKTVMRAPASKPPAAPPPKTVVKTMPKAPAATAQRVIRVKPGQGCPPGATGTIMRDGMAVRCGPQASPYVTEIGRGEAPKSGKNVYYNYGRGKGSWDDSRLDLDGPASKVSLASRGGATRIVPDQVWEARSEVPPVVPHGYRPAWEDDRLNPYRAWQTVDGFYDTQRRWTNTVPRVNDLAARRIEARDPILLYKDTATVAVPTKTPVYATSGSSTAQTMASRAPMVSTRSAPLKEAPAATASSRYVEIGLFTTRAKADAAASRLRQAGLPVRYARAGGDASSSRRVVVGPYASASALRGALGRVHAAGYVQAYLR